MFYILYYIYRYVITYLFKNIILLYYIILYYIICYIIILYYFMVYHIMFFIFILFYFIILYFIVLYYILLYYILFIYIYILFIYIYMGCRPLPPTPVQWKDRAIGVILLSSKCYVCTLKPVGQRLRLLPQTPSVTARNVMYILICIYMCIYGVV